jgi:hypothetical protein
MENVKVAMDKEEGRLAVDDGETGHWLRYGSTSKLSIEH